MEVASIQVPTRGFSWADGVGVGEATMGAVGGPFVDPVSPHAIKSVEVRVVRAIKSVVFMYLNTCKIYASGRCPEW